MPQRSSTNGKDPGRPRHAPRLPGRQSGERVRSSRACVDAHLRGHDGEWVGDARAMNCNVISAQAEIHASFDSVGPPVLPAALSALPSRASAARPGSLHDAAAILHERERSPTATAAPRLPGRQSGEGVRSSRACVDAHLRGHDAIWGTPPVPQSSSPRRRSSGPASIPWDLPCWPPRSPLCLPGRAQRDPGSLHDAAAILHERERSRTATACAASSGKAEWGACAFLAGLRGCPPSWA